MDVPSLESLSSSISEQTTIEPFPFEHVFALLSQHDWVYDFFFESSKEEVDMLKYAVSADTFLSVNFNLITYECNDPLADPYCQKEFRKCIYLPTFSTGSITVGFSIFQLISSTNSFALPDLAIGRFAYDVSTKRMLMISENPSLNLTEMQFLNLKSGSIRQSSVAMFYMKGLRNSLKKVRNGTSDIEDTFRESLIFDFHADELRICPTCNSSPCSCVVELTKKKHLLDTNADLQNLAAFCGGYQGRATMRLFSMKMPVLSVSFPSFSWCDPSIDNSVKSHLSEWALRDCMTRKTSAALVPRGLITDSPAEQTAEKEIKTALDFFVRACVITDEEEDDQNPSIMEITESPYTDGEILNVESQVQQSPLGIETGSLEFLADDYNIGNTGEIGNKLSNIFPRDNVQEAGMSINDEMDIGMPSVSELLSPEEIGLTNIRPGPNNDNIITHILPEHQIEQSEDHSAGSTHGSQTDNISAHTNSSEDQEINQTLGAITILPRQTPEQFEDLDERARRAAEEVVRNNATEQERRLQLRKQRNRLSAAKSNERRKKANEQMQRDYKETMKKKGELAKKQEELLKQNAILKEKLGSTLRSKSTDPRQ